MASKKRDSWSSNFGFIMAAAGAAIGLGNIWRFPYICGENGGGAFLIVYLACVFLIGMPVLVGELLIGRKAGIGGAGAFSALIKKNKKLWGYVGLLGILAGFLITSYYTIIAGWTLEYLWQSFMGNVATMDAESSKNYFDTFMASNPRQIFWHVGFSIITIAIVSGGVSGGIEKVASILMPVLLFILVGLALFGLNLEASMQAAGSGIAKSIDFMFHPRWEQFTAESMFQALGQAAFSLSIAVGTMVAYGSYLKKNENIANLGAIVVVMDTMVGILGGLVIFPIVFAFGLDPEAGTGLIFVTLPNLFSQIPGGAVLAPLFYILLFFAALTSSISLLEPCVTHLVDAHKYKRIPATLVSGAAATVLGIFWIVSSSLEQTGLFTNIDKFISNLMVPTNAILIAIFVGWVLDKKMLRKELPKTSQLYFDIFIFLCKWVCPVVVTTILIRGI
ncbi:MAG: sodium-dependent transporter [Candidatus Melainabacteria bacterium]|jgi:neurotransmitter:Na+ symporter, NSS family|nr:sodium-dependent transporter [Candidatus Melainabacteria bacterium]